MANTGDKGWTTLEQYNTATGEATGTTKPNVEGDPDYVAPVNDQATCPMYVPDLGWRGIGLYCITENGEHTGYQGYATLEEYDKNNGVATGATKANASGDPDHIADTYNESACERFVLSLNGNDLTWTPSAIPNISHYQVYKQQDGGFFAEIGDTATRHRDIASVTTTPADYCFKVRAENTVGVYGAYSNIVCFTRRAKPETTFSEQLASSNVSGTQACTNASNMSYTTYYLDTEDFFDATNITTNVEGTASAESGHYSDGAITRYWNGSAFSGNSIFCQI